MQLQIFLTFSSLLLTCALADGESQLGENRYPWGRRWTTDFRRRRFYPVRRFTTYLYPRRRFTTNFYGQRRYWGRRHGWLAAGSEDGAALSDTGMGNAGKGTLAMEQQPGAGGEMPMGADMGGAGGAGTGMPTGGAGGDMGGMPVADVGQQQPAAGGDNMQQPEPDAGGAEQPTPATQPAIPLPQGPAPMLQPNVEPLLPRNVIQHQQQQQQMQQQEQQQGM